MKQFYFVQYFITENLVHSRLAKMGYNPYKDLDLAKKQPPSFPMANRKKNQCRLQCINACLKVPYNSRVNCEGHELLRALAAKFHALYTELKASEKNET